MTEAGDEPEPPPLRAILPAVVAVYALMVALGWLWLWLRDRTSVVPAAAVGPHGPALSAAAGLLAGLGLFGVGRLLARYSRPFAELDARLGKLVGPLDEGQIRLVTLASAVGEEFFFRCAMQDALGFWPTAALFGLAHAGGGRSLGWWIPLAAVFGAAMGGLIVAGFGLLSAAIAHALFNYLSLRRYDP
jgi:hypothetical protein